MRLPSQSRPIGHRHYPAPYVFDSVFVDRRHSVVDEVELVPRRSIVAGSSYNLLEEEPYIEQLLETFFLKGLVQLTHRKTRRLR